MTPSDLAAPDGEPLVVGEPDPAQGRSVHLRVAPRISREVLRRRRLARLALLAVAAISAASMFLLVAFHVFAVQSAFQLDKLQTQLSSEQRKYELLRDRVATLSSPEAVARVAAGFGMVRATSVTLLHASAAAPFGSTVSLPVPPPTPYKAIDPRP